MSLIDKLKTAATGTLLAGAGLISSGCVSYEEMLVQKKITREEYKALKEEQTAAETSLLGGLLWEAGVMKDQPLAEGVGQAVSNHGASLAGRSNVTQNVYVSGNQPQLQVEQFQVIYSNSQSEVPTITRLDRNTFHNFIKEGESIVRVRPSFIPFSQDYIKNSQEFPKIKFGEVIIDRGSDPQQYVKMLENYGVPDASFPVVIFFRDGKILQHTIGFEELKNSISHIYESLD